jgi:hypothetical protein
MMTKDSIPKVEWTSCGDDLPEPNKFVWVCVGRVIEVGEARRYQREVHMGMFNGTGFQIFPYEVPILSNQVWCWANMMPPNPPCCRQRPETFMEGGEEFTDEL